MTRIELTLDVEDKKLAAKLEKQLSKIWKTFAGPGHFFVMPDVKDDRG